MGEIISIETLRLWREQEKENIELQERINKAIEYLKNNIADVDFMIEEYGYESVTGEYVETTFDDIEELTKILRGEK